MSSAELDLLGRHQPWAASSAGRAPRSQRGGREFEPRAVHHINPHLKTLQAGDRLAFSMRLSAFNGVSDTVPCGSGVHWSSPLSPFERTDPRERSRTWLIS